MIVRIYAVLVFLLAATAAAIPLAVGHYARPPDTRLGIGPLTFLGLGTLVVLGFIYDAPQRVFPQSHLIMWSIVGVVVGTWGFIAYGVLERLILPFVKRVRLWIKT